MWLWAQDYLSLCSLPTDPFQWNAYTNTVSLEVVTETPVELYTSGGHCQAPTGENATRIRQGPTSRPVSAGSVSAIVEFLSSLWPHLLSLSRRELSRKGLGELSLTGKWRAEKQTLLVIAGELKGKMFKITGLWGTSLVQSIGKCPTLDLCSGLDLRAMSSSPEFVSTLAMEPI